MRRLSSVLTYTSSTPNNASPHSIDKKTSPNKAQHLCQLTQRLKLSFTLSPRIQTPHSQTQELETTLRRFISKHIPRSHFSAETLALTVSYCEKNKCCLIRYPYEAIYHYFLRTGLKTFNAGSYITDITKTENREFRLLPSTDTKSFKKDLSQLKKKALLYDVLECIQSRLSNRLKQEKYNTEEYKEKKEKLHKLFQTATQLLDNPDLKTTDILELTRNILPKKQKQSGYPNLVMQAVSRH